MAPTKQAEHQPAPADLEAQAAADILQVIREGSQLGLLRHHLDSGPVHAQIQMLAALSDSGNRVARVLLLILGRLVESDDPEIPERVVADLGRLRDELAQVQQVLFAGDAATKMDTDALSRALDQSRQQLHAAGLDSSQPARGHTHLRDGGRRIHHDHGGGGTPHPHYDAQTLVDAAADWRPAVDDETTMPGQVGDHGDGEAS